MYINDTNERAILNLQLSRKFADELSQDIPKLKSNPYWNFFETRSQNSPTHKIEFFNKDNKSIYIYEINLDSPRFAKVISGIVFPWEERTYPITDFMFEEIINTSQREQ